MAGTDLSAIVVTNEHLLSGQVSARGRRLIQVLNDTTTDFVSMQNVRVMRRAGGACVATLPSAMVLKRNIALAIPANDQHESPEKRRDNFVHKRRFNAFLIVKGYEIRGQVCLKGTEDPLAALCHELGAFFPVPGGSVAFSGTSCDEQHRQVIVVNREYVSVFHLGEPLAERTVTAEPTAANARR